MKVTEITGPRAFTLEVGEEEMHILMSLVGYCSPGALGMRYSDAEGKLLAPMYEVMRSALDAPDGLKYKLHIEQLD